MCLALGLALFATASSAASYDFRIEQFGNPDSRAATYNADANTSFRTFARQFGAAMTSATLAPPETLGRNGFAVSTELSVIQIQGTSFLPTTSPISGPLLLPSIHVRKGLPWSFELGARAAWVEKSHMGIGTVELKWALVEGYAFLPDVGVRGHVSKLINARNLDLVAGGLDLSLGKRFAIAGMVTITPYAGWNLVFVGASTGNVDFNPSRTVADETTNQFQNIYAFEPLAAKDNAHNRFYLGFRFVAGLIQLGAEVSYALLGEAAAQGVWGYNATLGFEY